MLADYVRTGLSAWWAPGLAFVAGVVSFASPCVFPLVPGYLSFVVGAEAEEKRPLLPMLLFVGGFTLVFSALGVFATTLIPDIQSTTGQRVAGAVVIAFGVFMLLYALRRGRPGMYTERRPFLSRVRPGRAGAFPLGMAFAAGWTPCIGPVLGGILAIAAAEGGAARGAVLLLVYSLGLGVPFVLLGLGVRRLTTTLSFVKRNYHWFAGVSGAVMVTIGTLLVTGLWFRFLQPFLRAGSRFFPGL
ncbi:MAG: cytochrome c biogenesis protein CcdA [Actinomycetota bacterium]|nr:cytochrome c biogenesis protein CcdA [Actinomycetota bacterium]